MSHAIDHDQDTVTPEKNMFDQFEAPPEQPAQPEKSPANEEDNMFASFAAPDDPVPETKETGMFDEFAVPESENAPLLGDADLGFLDVAEKDKVPEGELTEYDKVTNVSNRFVAGALRGLSSTLKSYGQKDLQDRMATNIAFQAIQAGKDPYAAVEKQLGIKIDPQDLFSFRKGFNTPAMNILGAKQALRKVIEAERTDPEKGKKLRDEFNAKIMKNLNTTGLDILKESKFYNVATDIDGFIRDHFPEDKRLQDSLMYSKVPDAFGQAMYFMLAAILGKAALGKKSGAAGGAVSAGYIGSAVSYTEGFERALNKGQDFKTIFEAANRYEFIGYTEGIPLGNLLSRLDKGSGGLLKRSLKEALVQGTEESLQEFGSQVLKNASDMQLYDPKTGLWDNSVEGAEVGSITGALLGFLTTLALGKRGNLKGRDDKSVEDILDEQPDAPKTNEDIVNDAIIEYENGVDFEPSDKQYKKPGEDELTLTPKGGESEADISYDGGIDFEYEPKDILAPDYGIENKTQATRRVERDKRIAKLRERLGERRLPKGFTDGRLKRLEYREGLEELVAGVPPKKGQGKVINSEVDELLVAVAKNGGLDRREAEAQGLDIEDMKSYQSGVFGMPAFRKEGGLSFDGMAEALSQDGYVSEDYSANELLEKVADSLNGQAVYSVNWDPGNSAKMYKDVGNGFPPNKVHDILRKALSGKTLGVREAKVVVNTLDYLQDKRRFSETGEDHVDYAKQQLELAREARREAGWPIESQQPAGEDRVLLDDGWAFQENEYDDALDGMGRTFAEYLDDARAMGEDVYEQAQRIMEREAPDQIVLNELAQLLRNANENTEPQPAGTGIENDGAQQEGRALAETSESEKDPQQGQDRYADDTEEIDLPDHGVEDTVNLDSDSDLNSTDASEIPSLDLPDIDTAIDEALSDDKTDVQAASKEPATEKASESTSTKGGNKKKGSTEESLKKSSESSEKAGNDTSQIDQPMKRYSTSVGGKKIVYDYDHGEGIGKSGDHAQFVFHGKDISETGYKSHFVNKQAVDDAGGHEAFAQAVVPKFIAEAEKTKKQDEREAKKSNKAEKKENRSKSENKKHGRKEDPSGKKTSTSKANDEPTDQLEQEGRENGEAEPNDWGKKNTVFTEDAAKKARELLESKLGQLNSGIDPEVLQAGITLSGYHIEAGARKFKDFSAAMIKDLGEVVRPYLRSWYEAVRHYPGFDSKGMSKPSEIDQFLAKKPAKNTKKSSKSGKKRTKNAKLDVPDKGDDNYDLFSAPVSDVDSSGVSDVSGGRGNDTQHGATQTDSGGMEDVSQANGETADQAGDSGSDSVRVPTENVGSNGRNAQTGDAADGRKGAGGSAMADAGRGKPTKRNPAKPDLGADRNLNNFHIDDPESLVGGGQVARFKKNQRAIELYQDLVSEGRSATPDEQRHLAAYTGWGSFGQELFQGSWEHPQPKSGWEERDQWLRDHLGESEWKAAQNSIINAHYTDPPTVQTMWNMLNRMGFNGGRVLEPSMGIGNFIGLMPKSISHRSQIDGIELDELTGGMAKLIYPDANINIMGYQDSKTPDNFYDVVIGNWPFANIKIADRRYSKIDPVLHDYFFLKAVDQVRPGGIVIGITSKGTMDKVDKRTRLALAKQAELVTMFRLPSGAFKEYAGTIVVTDIVILKKRDKPIGLVEDSWKDSNEIEVRGEKLRINQFYIDHPENVVGEIDYGHGTTFKRPGLIVNRPDDMEGELKRITELVPENIFKKDNRANHIKYISRYGDEGRQLSIIEKDGTFYQVRGEQLAEINSISKYKLSKEESTKKREDQFRSLIRMGDAYAKLIDAERTDKDAEGHRSALREEYNKFVRRYGKLNNSFGLKYFEKVGDPMYPALAALEYLDGKTYKQSKILTQSTIRGKSKIDNPTPEDAFILVRQDTVNPTLKEIAEKANMDEGDVKAALIKSNIIYELPDGDIQSTDIYLSGNVREKLREAEAAVKEGKKNLQRNVDALKKVIPEDIPYHLIEVQLGVTWVGNEHYKKYFAELAGNADKSDDISIRYTLGRWKIRVGDELKNNPTARAWSANTGSNQISFQRLINLAISNQSYTVKYKDKDGVTHVDEEATAAVAEKIAKVREQFKEWVWQDPERRVSLEEEYNETRNAYARPVFDGSFLKMEGMALQLGDKPFNLRKHQIDAIWRGIVMRRSLNAHEVGTGKTFTMGGIAIESRRYGIAKKPLLFAHNANSATVAHEIQQMYPSAKILYIDNLSPKQIDVRLRQIRNDDWDLVVLPHSLIDRMALTEKTMMAMAEEEIALLEQEAREAADDDGVDFDQSMLDDPDQLKKLRSATAKDLVIARNNIIETIKKQGMKASRDGAVSFEDLGVDMLLVDEAHEFKKPPIVTKMRMKGLNTQTSNRSIALKFLTRYIAANNQGGNIHLFTGTPITNTMTEVFHHMRYIMEIEMEELGIDQWDGWFANFAEESTDVELNAAAEYENVTRLAKFINVPELRQLFGQYMDVVFSEDMPEMSPRKTKSGKTLDDASLTELEKAELINGRTEGAKDRPYKKIITESADMTHAQLIEFDKLQKYAKDWRNMTGKQRMDTMRKGKPESPIITEGLAAKASFDVRLLEGEKYAGQEGNVPDDKNSKASRAIKNLLDIYHSDDRATQVVFTEIGIGNRVTRSVNVGGQKKTRTFPVFSTVQDMVERLVQQGIPRSEIAVVTGSTSKQKRKQIAQAMNESKIRIVFGSTSTLGVGVNMQRNLRAMHHLDAPWMPGDLEQRNGRGHRQGNQWNTVLEYRYITDRLDGRRWQVLAVKDRFIKKFLHSNTDERVIEGEAAADEQSDILETFSEAAGDPRILLRIKAQKNIERLEQKERIYSMAVADAKRRTRAYAVELKGKQDELDEIKDSGIEEILDAAIKNTAADKFLAKIGGKIYSKRKDAQAAINAVIKNEVRMGKDPFVFGEIAGFKASLYMPQLATEPMIILDVPTKTGIKKVSSKKASIASIESTMRNYGNESTYIKDSIDYYKKTITSLEKVAGEKFRDAEKLDMARKQLKEIERDMEINPVPPPAWLRNGAPIDTDIKWGDKTLTVTGHRWDENGWFVLAQDEKGSVAVPYMEAKDEQGMSIYEEREFAKPEVVEKTDKDDNGVSFSISDEDVDKTVLADKLDNILKEAGDGSPLYLGQTPKILQRLGMKPLPTAMIEKNADKSMFDHGISVRQMTSVVEAINDPVAVVDSDSRNAPKGSLVVITDLIRSNGSPIIVAIHPDQTIHRVDVNEVKSVMAKDRHVPILEKWLKQKLRYINNEKRPEWQRLTGVQFPSKMPKRDVIRYILTDRDIVKADRVPDWQNRPKFKLSDKALRKAGLSRSAAQKIVDNLTKGWVNKPKITVLDNELGVPEQYFEHVWAQKSRGKRLRGFINDKTGEIFILAENNKSQVDIEQTIIHESIGHGGVRGLFGDDVVPLLRQVYLAYKDSEVLQKISDKYGFDLSKPENQLKAADELLAHLSEKMDKPSLWEKVVAFIRDLLRRMNFSVKLNNADLKKILSDAAAYVKTGKKAKSQSLEQERRAVMAGAVSYSQGAPTYYSQVGRILARDLPNKGGAKELAIMIQNWAKKGKFKQEELDWLGLIEWLREQNGKISKSDILEYVSANQIHVEEVIRGDNQEAINQWLENADAFVRENEDVGFEAGYAGTVSRNFINDVEAWDFLREEAAAQVDEYEGVLSAKFPDDQYNLPNGKNYKELVLTLPGKIIPYKPDNIHFTDEGGGTAVAWVRFNERIDADGKRLLFIEEIQSKRHQDGREKGYGEITDDEINNKIEDLKKQGWEIEKTVFDMYQRSDDPANKGFKAHLHRAHWGPVARTESAAWRAIAEKELDYIVRPPDAPFKTTWPLLAMKRMIRYAAENGFERIAWTTGEQQADRYDLRKELKSIRYYKKNGGTYHIKAEKKNGEQLTIAKDINKDELERHVGKEIAEKIIDDKGKQLKYSPFKMLDGISLAVGGEGMIAFYDKMLPSMANKYVKKWGGKVSDSEVFIGEESTIKVHSLDVTPKMHDAAMEGQPLFSLKNESDTGDSDLDGLINNMGGKKSGFVSRIKGFLDGLSAGGFGDTATQYSTDQFHAMRKSDKMAGKTEADEMAYVAARMSASTHTQLYVALAKGALKWVGNTVSYHKGSKGLIELLQPVADNIQLWEAYMVAKRAKRLAAEGRENLLTPAQIRKGIALGEKYPEFKQVAKDWATFNKHILDFAEQAGLIDPVQRKVWENSDYVPFYRILDDTGKFSGPRGNKGLSGQNAGIRQLKGGTAQLNDILENMVMNTAHMIDAAMKNHALRMAVDNYKGIGLIEKAAYEFKPELIPEGQIKQDIARRLGIPTRMVSQILPLGAMKGMKKMFALKAPSDKDVVRVMINGKPEFYHVTDQALLRSLTSINQEHWGKWMKLFTLPKHALTSLVTADPAFMAANFMRDTLSSYVLARDNIKPVVSGVQAIYNKIKNSDEYWEMLAAGGGFHSGYVNANDPEATARIMKKQMRKKGFKESVLDSPWKIWDAWQEFGSMVENANRIAIYHGAKKAGKSTLAAAFESRDILDFAKRGDGAIFQFLAQTVPFFNARLQGLVRLGQGARENPATFALRGSLIMAATIALYMLNKDDERYQDLEEWDKDTYWHFWLGDKHFRLPKPFEVGAIFGTLPERFMETAYGESKEPVKKLLDRIGWNLSEVFKFNPTPQALRPIIEQVSNKNFFTGRPIEGMSMERLEPEARYNQYTHETSIQTGKALGLSPARIDHVLRGYFGTLGDYALSVSDIAVRAIWDYPNPPALRVDEIPVIKRFYQSDPPRSNKYRTEFYELYKDLNEKYNTILAYRKVGDVATARAKYREYQNDLKYHKSMKQIARSVSKINLQLRRIHASKMSPDAKRKRIDSLIEKKNMLFKKLMKRINY